MSDFIRILRKTADEAGNSIEMLAISPSLLRAIANEIEGIELLRDYYQKRMAEYAQEDFTTAKQYAEEFAQLRARIAEMTRLLEGVK